MYLTMDDFGDDCVEKIIRANSEIDKWKLISDIADKYGFTGVQINPSEYREHLGLSLNRIPGFINKFRLTYHIGGLNTLESEEDCKKLSDRISEAVDISTQYGVEDVSFHSAQQSLLKHTHICLPKQILLEKCHLFDLIHLFNRFLC